MADLENLASDAANQTTRIPANLMGLLRQSYDTREKALDWILAIFVCAALVYAFRDQLVGLASSVSQNDPAAGDPNTGRAASIYPDMDISTAFPLAGTKGGRWPALYAYNMPASRNLRYQAGPSSGAPPNDPSVPNQYPS